MDGEARGRERGANVEALLAETPWLSRLARRLLSDDGAAEDLSQDVLAAALGERVELSGLSLRAWLRTAARRIAGRSAAREGARRGVERLAARAEAAVERDASERLELHRRLAAAIERLPAIYRTAIVLRYFEELPPQAVAERLGIPGTAARKRLSRGLALLREELDREYGERGTWALALGACLRWRGEPSAAPPGPVGVAGGAVIAMTGLKLALLATVATVALGWWWWRSEEGGEVVLSASPAAPEEALASPTASAEPRPESASDAGRRAVELPPAEGIAAEPVVAPRLRVVDASGAPVAGARAAVIDARGFVEGIELDGAASAAIPEEAAGARFAASALGYGPALSEAWEQGEVALALAPLRTVEGVVLEGGAPLERPIELSCWLGSTWVLGPNTEEIEAALSELHILEQSSRVRTGSDGSFQIQGAQDAALATLILPPSHCVVVINHTRVVPSGAENRNMARVPLDSGKVLIETELLPYISGRFVRAADGAPIEARFDHWCIDRTGRHGPVSSMSTDRDGAFCIGLQIDEAAFAGELDSRRAPSITRFAHLWVSGPGFRDLRKTIDLDGVDLPLDLGEIPLESVSALELRVTDESGVAIDGALAWTTESSVRTDREGLAQVEFEPGTELLVLAAGYSLGRLALDSESAGRSEITLRPGLAVEVVAKEEDGRGPDAGLRLKVGWNRLPFQGARGEDATWPAKIYFAFADMQAPVRGARVLGRASDPLTGTSGYLFSALPADGRALIPGLQARGELELSLVDPFDRSLVERLVLLQDQPGLQSIELEVPEVEHFRLLVTADGERVPSGSVHVQPTGAESWRAGYFPIRGGEVHVGPTIAGTYDLRVQASGRPERRIEACELVPNAPLVIELGP